MGKQYIARGLLVRVDWAAYQDMYSICYVFASLTSLLGWSHLPHVWSWRSLKRALLLVLPTSVITQAFQVTRSSAVLKSFYRARPPYCRVNIARYVTGVSARVRLTSIASFLCRSPTTTLATDFNVLVTSLTLYSSIPLRPSLRIQ